MSVGAALRTATRPVRRVRRVLATVDPDRSRLRLAATTVVTVVAVAVVLFAAATVAGAPVTAVIPGVVLAMISSMAVREARAGRRAATILLLAPVSVASIALASLLSPTPLVADAAFVGVAVAAVLLRALGARGTALGMLAFMSYFLAVFVRITPEQLPVVAAAQVVAALIAIGIRAVLSPRHPERDLQRMIAALGDRTGRVIDALSAAVDEGDLAERRDRALRSRLVAASSTASAVEDALDAAEEPVVEGIGNDLLGVRVLDFQLTIERLADAVRALLGDGLTTGERARLVAALARFAARTTGPVRRDRSSGVAPAEADHEPGLDGRLAPVGRILEFGAGAWDRIASEGVDPDDPALRPDDPDDPDGDAEEDDAPDLRQRLRDIARQAVQVGIAAALAIAVGTALSSTRWFWAVITAFVVYTGTSTRGDILSKGSQRVVGTLAGVVVGVGVAALVGGNTVLAVALIVVCVFFGVYLLSVSSAFMIFFITTMLALLYGLLGEFSVGLLLTRLAETAAGAVIGVGVAYVVLPTSTQQVARERTSDVLDALADAVSRATARLRQAGDLAVTASSDDAGALRHALDELRTAAKPITHGFAGVTHRSGSRRTVQLLGACAFHGTALLRIAAAAPGAAGAPALERAFSEAGGAVRANIEAFSSGLGGGIGGITLAPATALLDALEAQPEVESSDRRAQLVAAIGDLRAIDQAICDRARELGATIGPPKPSPTGTHPERRA